MQQVFASRRLPPSGSAGNHSSRNRRAGGAARNPIAPPYIAQRAPPPPHPNRWPPPPPGAAARLPRGRSPGAAGRRSHGRSPPPGALPLWAAAPSLLRQSPNDQRPWGSKVCKIALNGVQFLWFSLLQNRAVVVHILKFDTKILSMFLNCMLFTTILVAVAKMKHTVIYKFWWFFK